MYLLIRINRLIDCADFLVGSSGACLMLITAQRSGASQDSDAFDLLRSALASYAATRSRNVLLRHDTCDVFAAFVGEQPVACIVGAFLRRVKAVHPLPRSWASTGSRDGRLS